MPSVKVIMFVIRVIVKLMIDIFDDIVTKICCSLSVKVHK